MAQIMKPATVLRDWHCMPYYAKRPPMRNRYTTAPIDIAATGDTTIATAITGIIVMGAVTTATGIDIHTAARTTVIDVIIDSWHSRSAGARPSVRERLIRHEHDARVKSVFLAAPPCPHGSSDQTL